MADLGAKDLFVLGRISRRPTYGHEIMQTIRTSRADLWVELSDKHVYYILRKLEERRLIAAEEPADGGSSRRVYSITPEGRTTLRRLLAEEGFARSLAYSDFDVVLAMLAYTDALPPEERTEVLEARLEEIDRRLAEEYEPLMGRSIEQRFGAAARALYDKGRYLNAAERAWLVALIEEVERDGWDRFAVREPTPEDADTEARGLSKSGKLGSDSGEGKRRSD
jgi:DNA-binding PadR family transcriptional regulator